MFLGFFGRVPRRGAAQWVRLWGIGVGCPADSHGIGHGVGHAVAFADRTVR
ncbi:hypothetical protein [Streptomyces sp. NPDC057199]|uniref:hypothetical protein n=1 Tax=Streptomyces sp. NPDC057199 TaxID=3346047 RepID=UPI00363F6757